MNLEVEPPEKKSSRKKKRKSSPPSPSPSFSLLPDEITENFLARISRSQYPTLSIVSKSFRSVLSSTELYAARSHLGSTEQCLYICLFDRCCKCTRWLRLWINPNGTRRDSMIKKKKKKKTIGRLLVPIPFSNHPSLSTHTAIAVGSEIYVIGGPATKEPSPVVRVLDCRSHTWRDAPSMNVARKHAGACVYDGKIYVTGGWYRGLEEDQPWGEVFDTKTQTWEGLPNPDPGAEVRHWIIHRIAEMEGKICLGYPNNVYAYDTKQGRWESREGSYATLPGLDCVVMDNVSYSFGRKVGFLGIVRYGCWWYDVNGDCKEVKGLDSLGDFYRRNGGSNLFAAKVVGCDGKLLVIWEGSTIPSPSHTRNGMMKIWCAQILVEKRDGGEVWGNVEWVDAVHTIPIGCRLLHCLVVSV